MSTPAFHQPPLRAVLLYSAGHLGSAVAFHVLSSAPEIDIVAVIRAEPAPLSGAGLKKAGKHLRKLGLRFAWLLLWQRFIQFLFFHLIAPRLADDHLLSAWQLARERGLPSLQTDNINSAEAQAFIARFTPDLILSVFFSRIIKPPVLALPRLGCLNLHPGFLPDYKGAMNYFWVLRNGEDRVGVSVHWMNEGIDTGPLLARRTVRLRPGATQQRALVLAAVVGSRMLQRACRKLRSGNLPEAIPAEPHAGRYFPLPGWQDFNAYFKRRRFFRIRDIAALILHRHRRFHRR